MKLDGIEVLRLQMPLVSPFRTSFATQKVRELVLVRAVGPDGEGWGECVAFPDPLYSSEYLDATLDAMRRFLIPVLLELGEVRANRVGEALAPFRGHRMAKGALEMAMLDAELRARGESLAAELGSVRAAVPSGVSVGIMDDVPHLLETVAGYLDAGYVRIKLKIEPGWDVEPVRAVRERFGDALLLQVDANAAYTLRDSRHLAKLDDLDLLLIEQPLDEDDILGHVRLAQRISTPVCLDESVTSARSAATAIALGACEVINIKPGRVGGYLEARRIHDLCVANGIAAWCGGMLETGLGRAANAALASLPGFTLAGDISASNRFYDMDITEPFVLENGAIHVPTGPGIGVVPIPERVEEHLIDREWFGR